MLFIELANVFAPVQKSLSLKIFRVFGERVSMSKNIFKTLFPKKYWDIKMGGIVKGLVIHCNAMAKNAFARNMKHAINAATI